ncbi:hypothetical protein ACWBC2_16130 [Salegentibacter agarivorans]
MKLYSKCTNCLAEMMLKSDSHNRGEFAMLEGKIKKIRCKHCASDQNIHVNNIYAKESKLALVIALLIFSIGTPLTVFLMLKVFTIASVNHYVILIAGGILLIPVIIYIIITKEEQTRVSSFNRYKMTE